MNGNQIFFASEKGLQQHKIRNLKLLVTRVHRYRNIVPNTLLIFLALYSSWIFYNNGFQTTAEVIFTVILFTGLIIIMFIIMHFPIFAYPTLKCTNCDSDIFLHVRWLCRDKNCALENNNLTFIETFNFFLKPQSPLHSCKTCGVQPPAIVCGNCKNVIVTDLENLEKNHDYVIELTGLFLSEKPMPAPKPEISTSPLDDDLI